MTCHQYEIGINVTALLDLEVFQVQFKSVFSLNVGNSSSFALSRTHSLPSFAKCLYFIGFKTLRHSVNNMNKQKLDRKSLNLVHQMNAYRRSLEHAI